MNGGFKKEAEKSDIEIVRKDETCPDQLVIEIDKKLQSACQAHKIKSDDAMPPTSSSAAAKSLDYIDYESNPGKFMASA